MHTPEVCLQRSQCQNGRSLRLVRLDRLPELASTGPSRLSPSRLHPSHRSLEWPSGSRADAWFIESFLPLEHGYCCSHTWPPPGRQLGRLAQHLTNQGSCVMVTVVSQMFVISLVPSCKMVPVIRGTRTTVTSTQQRPLSSKKPRA
jgi:hypothetical protein